MTGAQWASAQTSASVGSWFSGAETAAMGSLTVPAFHSGGIVGNDVPAILQKGETVLSRGDSGVFFDILKDVRNNSGGVTVIVQGNMVGNAEFARILAKEIRDAKGDHYNFG
jgi:hypothetical protein